MPHAGFKPTIPASEQLLIHALDRAATGIGSFMIRYGKLHVVLPKAFFGLVCSISKYFIGTDRYYVIHLEQIYRFSKNTSLNILLQQVNPTTHSLFLWDSHFKNNLLTLRFPKWYHSFMFLE
jgi:phage gp36-like protein